MLSLTAECETFTIIQNVFLDESMTDADGDYVKVYLCLLRGMATTISDIADRLNFTEKDVERAIRYWTSKNVLQARIEGDNTIITIPKLQYDALNEIAITEEPNIAVEKEYTGIFEDLKIYYEGIYGEPIDKKEKDALETLADNFDYETAVYLIDICIQDGKKSGAYIKQAALYWKQKGITSIKQAIEINEKNKLIRAMYYHYFKLNKTRLAPIEQEYIAKIETFDLDYVKEAFKNVILDMENPKISDVFETLDIWKKKDIVLTQISIPESDLEAKSTGNTKNVFNNYTQIDMSTDLDEMEQLFHKWVNGI